MYTTHEFSDQSECKDRTLGNGTDRPYSQMEDGKGFVDSNGNEVYIVKLEHGYLSIIFSVVQTIILIFMMIQCKIAPMKINPMFGPYPDALSYWGGKNAYLILEDNEWWRLITPIFLHAGVIHLICNIAVQLDTCAFFEREWGSKKWLLIYVTSAVGSSILSVISLPNTISVGSSGAVCGLFGGKLAEIVCRSFESQKTQQGRIGHEIRSGQLRHIIVSVVLIAAFSFIPYVDWAAHLGGFVTGLFIGFLLFSTKVKTFNWSIMWLITGTVLTAASFCLAFYQMYSSVDTAEELKDLCGYYKKNFDDYECNCMLKRNNG